MSECREKCCVSHSAKKSPVAELAVKLAVMITWLGSVSSLNKRGEINPARYGS